MEEERVVCEIPVYLSKALSKKLYLIQIPQRPATVPLDESELVETKIKPEQGKLQFTLGLSTEGPYYDEFHGETLAEAAEGLGLNQDEYISDERRRIDKTVLESSNPKLASSERYVAGIIKDGAVHLTSLNSVLQMKPVLPYLNKADNAKAKLDAAASGTAGDTEDETEEEATKVTVKFKRNNAVDGNSKPSTSKSSLAARKKDEEELWVNLEYEGKNPEVYNQLCTQNMENDAPMYVLTQKDYLSKIFPKYKETVIDGSDRLPKSTFAHQRINTMNMKDMTLAEQLKVLILNGKVMRYDQIIDFLKTRIRSTPDETTLLRTLQTVAVLVQGCWVAKSELLYPDTFKSNTNGVPGPIMQAARDTVLSIFTEERFVERKRISPMLHIPKEEVSEILSSISQRVLKRGWEFLLPYDHSFIARHPDVVQRQNKIWEVKSQHQRSRKMSESAGSSRDPLKPPSRSPPRRRHSRTMSFSSDNESGSEAGGEQRKKHASGSSGGSGNRQRRPSSSSRSDAAPLGGGAES